MDKLIILGFDIRRPIADQNSSWPEERRIKFLIRHEVPAPISVDVGVWPAFATNPDETFPLQLWGSVSDIVTTFPDATQWRSNSPVIIEIAAIATGEQSSEYWEGILLGRVEPEKDKSLKVTPEVLGYDVADRYLVSGISNCMLSADELVAVRKDWSEALNVWGLIENKDAAEAIRAVCDRLIPEHAPFETYRLRRIVVGNPRKCSLGEIRKEEGNRGNSVGETGSA